MLSNDPCCGSRRFIALDHRQGKHIRRSARRIRGSRDAAGDAVNVRCRTLSTCSARRSIPIDADVVAICKSPSLHAMSADRARDKRINILFGSTLSNDRHARAYIFRLHDRQVRPDVQLDWKRDQGRRARTSPTSTRWAPAGNDLRCRGNACALAYGLAPVPCSTCSRTSRKARTRVAFHGSAIIDERARRSSPATPAAGESESFDPFLDPREQCAGVRSA